MIIPIAPMKTGILFTFAIFLFLPFASAGDITLAWDANTEPELKGYRLCYGTLSGQYTTVLDAGNVTTYTVKSLAAGTYYFTVKAYGVGGLESAFSNEVAVVVSGAVNKSDTQPPIINGIESTSITQTTAVIIWSTDERSDSRVEYGTTPAYGMRTGLYSGLTTAHSVPLSGLATATTYYYRIRSKDAAGNLATSSGHTFTTAAPPDTTAPTITRVVSSSISSTGATISWTTNEAANTQVDYGTTKSYGGSSALNSTLSTSHSQALSGLTAGTTYHYRARSRDAAGNLAVSGDHTFVTASLVDIYSGLVAAYAFDEGRGSSSVDYSGNGNAATLYSTKWSNGKYGRGLYFNGSSSYVKGGTTAMPGMSGPKTISFWLYLTSQTASIQSLVGIGNPAMNASVHYGLKGNRAGVFNYKSQWMLISKLPSGWKWHHIGYVFSGSQNLLYIDGALAGSSTIAPASAPATAFEIGRWIGGSGYFKGYIDEVRVYNRALSLDELTLAMNTPIAAAASDGVSTSTVMEMAESVKPAGSDRTGLDPVVTLDLERRNSRRRQTARARSFWISNPSDQGREVELKTWIALPGMLPLALDVATDADAEDVLVLDAGMNREYAVPSTQLESARIGVRLLDPVTGRILSEDITAFRSERGRNRFVEAKPDLTLESIIEDGLPQFILRNNGETPASVELKLWLETVDGDRDPLLSSGADGLLVLPAGATLMINPLASMDIPAGDYVIRARLLDPSSGEILAEK